MERPTATASEHSTKIDFDVQGVVGVRVIDPSPRDLNVVCKLLGSPPKLPLTAPDITVRFTEGLPVHEMRFLGADEYGFTDRGFFLLEKGTQQAKARIPFDRLGEPCEIVCKRRGGSIPLLMPIVGLTALKKECVPLHASAFMHNGVGVLMAGWPHCGKTTALLGFASRGAEYVGEEFVLLSGDGKQMQGLVRPMELTHSQISGLANVRSAVSFKSRIASRGVGLAQAMQNVIFGARIQRSFVSRSLRRVSAAIEDRLRPAITPSAIFGDRMRHAGAQADKIFLLLTHEDPSIAVEPIAPLEMARRLAVLVQHEFASLLHHYTAYRFAFPRRRNDFMENAADYSLAILVQALRGKETYIVRLPYPHSFPELFRVMQPLCRPASTAAEPAHTFS